MRQPLNEIKGAYKKTGNVAGLLQIPTAWWGQGFFALDTETH